MKLQCVALQNVDLYMAVSGGSPKTMLAKATITFKENDPDTAITVTSTSSTHREKTCTSLMTCRALLRYCPPFTGRTCDGSVSVQTRNTPQLLM